MSQAPDFHGELDRLQGHLPDWAARNLHRLRQPEAVWVRVPAGVALTGGGIFSILPLLGLWMLPIGLALLAVDVPPMRRPMARALAFTNGTIEKRKIKSAARRNRANPIRRDP